MSDIRHILLIPTEGDPHGLLAEGPCGARPPMAWLRGRRDGIWRPAPWFPDEREPLWALVLAWDGEPGDEVQPYIERAGIDYALLAPFVTYALKGMDIGQGPWPGTLVLLDAEGREVKDSPATGPQQEKTGGE